MANTIKSIKNYTSTLTRSMLDALVASWERFFNVQKINSDNIQAGSIETKHLQIGAVEKTKKAALGEVCSGTTEYAVVGGDPISDLTRTFTPAVGSTSHPVFIGAMTQGSYTVGALGPDNFTVFLGLDTHATPAATYIIDREGTNIAHSQLRISGTTGNGTIRIPSGVLWHIDTGSSASATTYKIESASVSGTIRTTNTKMIVYEID